jgi:hypothetical protein
MKIDKLGTSGKSIEFVSLEQKIESFPPEIAFRFQSKNITESFTRKFNEAIAMNEKYFDIHTVEMDILN